MRGAILLLAAWLTVSLFQVVTAAEGPTNPAAAPTERLLKSLKQAFDSDQFLQDAFYTDDNLKHFFNASSIQWLTKDENPRLGQVARIKSDLPGAADVQVSHLVYPKDSGHGPQMRFAEILIKGIALTQEQVTSVFGSPSASSVPAGDGPGLQYGDVPASHSRWDGVSRKGATFTLGTDGSIRVMVSNGVRPKSQ